MRRMIDRVSARVSKPQLRCWLGPGLFLSATAGWSVRESKDCIGLDALGWANFRVWGVMMVEYRALCEKRSGRSKRGRNQRAASVTVTAQRRRVRFALTQSMHCAGCRLALRRRLAGHVNSVQQFCPRAWYAAHYARS